MNKGMDTFKEKNILQDTVLPKYDFWNLIFLHIFWKKINAYIFQT